MYEYDPYGKPIPWRDDSKWVDPSRTRDKRDYSYSYDEFFIFGSRSVIARVAGADYSDRLWQWDHQKADSLWAKHVATRWAHATGEQLSAFISAYHGKDLKVVALAEGCNPSSGYPYWIIWYRENS